MRCGCESFPRHAAKLPSEERRRFGTCAVSLSSFFEPSLCSLLRPLLFFQVCLVILFSQLLSGVCDAFFALLRRRGRCFSSSHSQLAVGLFILVLGNGRKFTWENPSSLCELWWRPRPANLGPESRGFVMDIFNMIVFMRRFELAEM